MTKNTKRLLIGAGIVGAIVFLARRGTINVPFLARASTTPSAPATSEQAT